MTNVEFCDTFAEDDNDEVAAEDEGGVEENKGEDADATADANEVDGIVDADAVFVCFVAAIVVVVMFVSAAAFVVGAGDNGVVKPMSKDGTQSAAVAHKVLFRLEGVSLLLLLLVSLLVLLPLELGELLQLLLLSSSITNSAAVRFTLASIHS